MNELFELLLVSVSEMRDLQKQFFRDKRDVIEQAKIKEREVDRIIAEIQELRNPQKKLF